MNYEWIGGTIQKIKSDPKNRIFVQTPYSTLL